MGNVRVTFSDINIYDAHTHPFNSNVIPSGIGKLPGDMKTAVTKGNMCVILNNTGVTIYNGSAYATIPLKVFEDIYKDIMGECNYETDDLP